MKATVQGKQEDIQALWLEGDVVRFIDQRRLPHELVFYDAKNLEECAYAISNMVVRGAPSIGAAGAYGMAQAYLQNVDMGHAAKVLKATRPTAYDLFYAIDHILEVVTGGGDPVEAAKKYASDIIDMCRSIGRHGEGLIKDGAKVLTHCNAGALATVDYGTALAPIRTAHENGKGLFVFADETRPRLQGARLTAWELAQSGIPHAIIADNAAGYYMIKGEIDLCIVGADRITAGGDVANKIGTYEKAVVAHENDIPFYVAAPISTFDFSIEEGSEIPIEERDEEEVKYARGTLIANPASPARNPAFDYTPARYITGIITEKGVFKPEEIHGLK